MSIASDWRPRVVAALLVVAASVFVIGVASESGGETHRDEQTGGAAGHTEGSESAQARAGEGTEGTETSESAESAESAESDDERVLGLDVESPASVTAALVLSTALAALVLWRPDRRVLVATVLAAIAFAVLDIAEVAHQVDDNKAGLVVLAAAIAALHAATAALAAWYAAAGASADRPA